MLAFIARRRVPLFAAAILAFGAFSAGAEELPSYQVAGFPISPLQMSVLGSAHMQERLSDRASRNGMPASEHQMAVLAPSANPAAQRVAQELPRSEKLAEQTSVR